jgi:hypothetical protein
MKSLNRFLINCFILSAISWSSLKAQAPINDDCTGAVALPVSATCSYTQYTTTNATSSVGISNPTCGNYLGNDVWFKFIAPASGAVEINTNIGQITDGVMSLYSGSCGGTLTEVECDDDDSPNGLMAYLLRTGLTPGSTYYIRFWAYNNAQAGTFSICVNTPSVIPTSPCSNSNPGGCGCPNPNDTTCYLLPDIQAGRRTLNETRGWDEYDQLVTGVNKALIRIDVSTPNVGWGPMEVTPTNDYICGGDTLRDFFPSASFLCPDGSYPKRLINQRIYHKIGNRFEYELRPAGFMVYHPSHGHIHLDGWGLYTLRLRDTSVADTIKWPIVNSGIKVSFCLIDLNTCSGALGDCIGPNGSVYTNDSVRNYGLGGGYNCGNQLQGISTGKVDIYGRYLDESFVRIPYEACNGTYHVVVQIDPDNHFLETNDNNNWLAARTPLTRQRTTGTNPYAYIFSAKGNVMCQSDSLPLHASGASSYLWNTGQTTQDITVRQPGRYWVKATTPCGVTTSDTLDVYTSAASAYPESATADTVCAGQTAHLYASGNAHWYDAPTGGNLLHVGNDFQTGTLTANTTFYVADQPPMLQDSVGPVRSTFSNAGHFTATREDYLIFNAFMPFMLKKVTINAQTAGIRYFQLRTTYGDVIVEKALVVQAGEQEIELGFHVPAGLNLQLGVSTTQGPPQLYSSTTTNANIGYPYKVNALLNIVGSSTGDKMYPFFYNWKVEGMPQTCNDGARLPITAVVAPNSNPTISGLDPVYLHTDNPVLVGLNPPGGALSGDGVLGNTFNPATAGTGVHTLTYVYAYGNCIRQTAIQTEVKFDSSVIVYDDMIKVLGNPGNTPRLQVTSNTNTAVTIRLYSSIGQLISSQRVGVQRGNNLIGLNLESIAKGVYMLEVIYEADGRKIVQKIVR